MKLETLQAELNKIERRRAKLEQQIRVQAETLYTSLPRKVGLKNVDALVLALVPYASPAVRKKLDARATAPLKSSPRVKKDPAPAKVTQMGDKRMRYSDEKKAAVRRAVQEGKLTIREISTKHGVPTDSIKKWKRKWGLTARRKSAK